MEQKPNKFNFIPKTDLNRKPKTINREVKAPFYPKKVNLKQDFKGILESAYMKSPRLPNFNLIASQCGYLLGDLEKEIVDNVELNKEWLLYKQTYLGYKLDDAWEYKMKDIILKLETQNTKAMTESGTLTDNIFDMKDIFEKEEVLEYEQD